MKTQNILLKQAVTSVLAIIGLSAQLEAFAIGLSDINVKSHLGQPLRATIKVQGLAGLKDLDCFRLGTDAGNINAINQADLKLGKLQNDSAILTITTNDVILEPITSLTLITECGSTLSRNYVLLIDPVLTSEVNSLGLSANPTQVKKSQNNDDNDENVYDIDNSDYLQPIFSNDDSQPYKQVQAPKLNEKSSVNAKREKKINNKGLISDQKVSKRITNAGNQSNNSANASDASLSLQQMAQPKSPLTIPPLERQNPARLSISGLETLRVNANAIATPEVAKNSNLSRPKLNFDNSLHLTAETAPQAQAIQTAYLDEATVLSNRLAHLEQQISMLKVRNAELEGDKRQQVNVATVIPTLSSNSANGVLSWWPYALGASIIASAYFANNWWRRRRETNEFIGSEEVWASTQTHKNNTPYVKVSNLEEDLFDLDSNQPFVDVNKNPTKNLDSFEADQFVATSIEVEDNSNQNILDHVDVFLSHGRIQLAIQLLQNHLLEFPKQSVTIWLFLLELLAKENLPEIYNQTALECKEHFNIRVAEFTNDEASEKQSFEDFVRLIAGLEQIWGTSAALNFCDDLIYNNRLESRIGFDKNVLEEIILLRNIAQETLKSAEVIQLEEKKNMIKERKEAQIAANKQTKLLKMEELHLTLAPVEQFQNDASAPEGLFEFNLVEYK